ncbi:MAG: iron-containing alcohol dehydrogenase [Nitrospiraceae bacterium]|nr:iron-containing alcohol dehydrogenase [Nitrospiraceae bacterium]
MKPFRYLIPTEVVSGTGCLAALRERTPSLGNKAFVVTGRHSAQVSGALDRLLAFLPDAAVFDAVEENPRVDACDEAARRCRKAGCDFVVAVGGGSPMDAGKAIALLAANPEPCAAYLDGAERANPHLPIVAIPTTAGTGSEVTPYSVLVEERAPSGDGRVLNKRTLPELFPGLALLDPELSVTMPRSVTANTGLDALSQVMEGAVSRRSTPVGDALAYEACGAIKTWLPRAVAEPGNVEARAQMLYAAMLSGCVIAHSGTTLVHGMGYYFTLEYGVPHGLANALLLTPIFQFNARHEPQTVARLATALGHPAESTPADAAAQIGNAIHELLSEIGVSPVAAGHGVASDRLQWCAEEVFPDRGRFKNQPGEPTLGEVAGFFEQAHAGRITP